MTNKEISAAVMVLSVIVITAYVAYDTMVGGAPASLPIAAWKMLWAIGYSIAFNIVAVIIGVIVISIIQREGVADERADERDRLIDGKSVRNAYLVLSIGVLGVLIWQALGLDTIWGPYALFGVSMLAAGIYSGSQLVYYRIG